MKLLTQEIIKKLPKLYSTENIPLEDKEIAVKFFCPWNQWTWYAVEGQKNEDGNDWVFFGYVVGTFPEWGYWTLNQLLEIRGPFGLKVERDMYFSNRKAKDILVEIGG